MKIQNITDITAFFEAVDQCVDKVELVTGDGDCLNLCSKLSQYVSMANIFVGGRTGELEIRIYSEEDKKRLMPYMIPAE